MKGWRGAVHWTKEKEIDIIARRSPRIGHNDIQDTRRFVLVEGLLLGIGLELVTALSLRTRMFY